MSCCHRNCQDPREVRAKAHQVTPHLYLQASCQLRGKRCTVWKYYIPVADQGQTTRICRMPASIILDKHPQLFYQKTFFKPASA